MLEERGGTEAAKAKFRRLYFRIWEPQTTRSSPGPASCHTDNTRTYSRWLFSMALCCQKTNSIATSLATMMAR